VLVTRSRLDIIRRRISFGSLVKREFERGLVEELWKVAREEVYFRWIGGSGFGFRFQGRFGGCGIIVGRSGYGTFSRWVMYRIIFPNLCSDFLSVILLRDAVVQVFVKDLQ
jgi:hypothetical protein